MSKSSSSSGSGIGFFGLLAIVFITLKLTHFIDWSWFWVLAPIWVPMGAVLLIILIIGIPYTIKELAQSKND